MGAATGINLLWKIARIAVEQGWDVRVQPRGSSCTVIAFRGGTELVASWRRRDRDAQGDGAGRWWPEGAAIVSAGGSRRPMLLGDVAGWLTGGGR